MSAKFPRGGGGANLFSAIRLKKHMCGSRKFRHSGPDNVYFIFFIFWGGGGVLFINDLL